MIPLMKAKRHKLVSESAGMTPDLYVFDFQMLASGLLSQSYYPQALRERDMKKEVSVEPIGQKTSIPHKHFRWQPNRYDMYSVWDLDGPEGPGQDDGPNELKPGVEQTVDADKPMETQEPAQDIGPIRQKDLNEAAKRVDEEQPNTKQVPQKVIGKPSFAVLSNNAEMAPEVAGQPRYFTEQEAREAHYRRKLENLKARKQGFTRDDNGFYEKTVGVDYTPMAKHGYFLKTKLTCMSMDEKPVEITSAYNVDGHYIGDPKTAKFLCEEKGISPILASPNNRVCSVGKSRTDGKWYGWSHRAIYGFEKGSAVKKGDCAYKPATLADATQSLHDWHDDSSWNKDANPKNEVHTQGVGEKDNEFLVRVQRKSYHNLSVKNPSPNPVINSNEIEHVPKGRGEWVAESEMDAKQMACDFAESVSKSIVDPDQFVSGDLLYAVVDLNSESKADKNVMDYGWYRYGGAKTRKYNNHHRSIDLEIETGERFGIRYSKRTKAVMLLHGDLLTDEFKLSEREAKLLLKGSKPFGGKIGGTKLQRGNGDLQQFTTRTKQVAQHAKTANDKRAATQGPVGKTVREQPGEKFYFGFFQPSINQPERMAYVVDDSVANCKKQLDTFMAKNAKLGSRGCVTVVKGRTATELMEKMGKRKIAYIKSIVAQSIMKKGRVVAKDYLPKGVTFYDEASDVPHFNESKFVPAEPVYSGNEDAVLTELHDAVTREGFFTGMFRQQMAPKGKLVRRASGRPFIVFTSRTVNKKMIQEAERFVERVKGVYGKAVSGKVLTGSKDAGRDTPKIMVTIIMTLKKAPADQQKRSEIIHTLVKNSQRKDEISKQYTRIWNQMEKEKNGNAKAQLRKQLEKLSNESAKAKSLAFQTPMYTVKSGTSFIVVEVMDVDIPKGQVIIRNVRARGAAGNRATTNLYTYDGSIQIV